MPTDPSISVKDPREKRNRFAEVSDAEKQLWARIHSEGVLGNKVKDLYHKACCIYEKLFLSNNELSDLQSIEYLLWRLHYKHIDEFRRRISQSSGKEEDKLSHIEGFKSFLSEATKYYQELIRKIKRFYGLLDEPWFYKNSGVSHQSEQLKLHKCQFVCHRLCICLGDLARYLELYEKPDNQRRNWSVAASYYLEAAKIYPDSGNPQNQLAVLATYIGDEFLALYHCIRSLAVKEPFPDALENLMLLFERNRSSDIGSLSNDVYDFCKPSKWIFSSRKSPENDGFFNNRKVKVPVHDESMETDLWSLFIRTTSFFFLEFSLDTFFSTFTSTLRELEALLLLDVAKLSSALESYQNMNLSKAGPYRALHIISVLLFIIHNLTEDPERKILKPTNESHRSTMVKLALTITFIFMGRLVDRCLKGSPVIYFPLLPALLVFVEWLVSALDKLDTDDEKCESSMSYFFGSLVELLNHFQENRSQVTISDRIALWEDYELRGFIPLSHTHVTLDFSSHWEEEINYKMKNEYRAHRIVQAAIKIAKRSSDNNNNTRRWVFYNEAERKFYGAIKRKRVDSGRLSTVVEEEEDIVFKPITRRNSEPIPMNSPEAIGSAHDESLRRASSLLVAQNRVLIDSLTSSCSSAISSTKQTGQNEPTIAAGPPSLSSWVLNGERLSSGRANGIEISKTVLKPIDEFPTDELRSLSLNTKDDRSGAGSPEPCRSPYCAPAPSAPLLPENAVWLTGTSSTCFSTASASRASGHQTGPSVLPTIFVDHSSQFLSPSSSSPWSGPHFLDGWSYNHPLAGGPPLRPPSSSLLRGLYDQRADMLSRDHREARPEPEPLLQYLKQRELQLQQESQFRGFPYMRS